MVSHDRSGFAFEGSWHGYVAPTYHHHDHRCLNTTRYVSLTPIRCNPYYQSNGNLAHLLNHSRVWRTCWCWTDAESLCSPHAVAALLPNGALSRQSYRVTAAAAAAANRRGRVCSRESPNLHPSINSKYHQWTIYMYCTCVADCITSVTNINTCTV